MKSDDSKYFRWLVEQIDNGEASKYKHLLNDLFDISYRWIVELDGNRALDGMDLRRRFRDGYDRDIGCSVLEMLVALSIRFEHDVMCEPGDEDPSRWFWLILRQLDLDLFTDDSYDFVAVNSILELFMSGQKCILKSGHKIENLATKDLWWQLGVLSNEIF